MSIRNSEPHLGKDNCTTEAIAVFATLFIRRFFSNGEFYFSPESLENVDRILRRFASGYPDSTAREKMKIEAGCYVLEVARMNYGGDYHWWEERHMPVLVCGAPRNRIAIATFDKVLRRIEHGGADNIAFFFSGFAESMRRAKTQGGIDAVHV